MEIHHESVRRFALAINRDIARIQISRRIDGSRHARHDYRIRRQRRHRSYAGLNRQQVRITAPVQGQRFDLLFGNDFAEMRRDRIDLSLNCLFGLNHRDCVGSLSQLHRGVDAKRSVGIDADTRLLPGLKSSRLDGQIVVANGERRERVNAILVGGRFEFCLQRSVDQTQFGARDGRAARIFDHPGDAACGERRQAFRRKKKEDDGRRDRPALGTLSSTGFSRSAVSRM